MSVCLSKKVYWTPPKPFRLNYNLGQNIVDKFTKLSKIGFSMERFTADFLQFSNATVKIYLLGGRLDTHVQFQAIQGFY